MIYAAAQRKALGAYYTDDAVAQVIARWAVQGGDRVLDPSCGDGVFLRAACAQTSHSPRIVVGVEISESQSEETRAGLAPDDRVQIVRSDFFDYYAEPFDAVVGNPPFIRYQAFTGESREKALFRCAAAGVRLNRLCSSWAPFVIAAGEMLREGGRMGFVLPVELLHAGYAKPVLHYLNASFDSVTLITFEQRLFPDLSQDALVLLASGKGRRCNALLHVEAKNIAYIAAGGNEFPGRRVDPEAYLTGGRRIKETLVDPASTAALDVLLSSENAFRLGKRMRADIGYVTGANEFFHLTKSEASARRIPPRFLSPTVYRGGSLAGLAYRVDDWDTGNGEGTSGYLLRIPADARLTLGVERYLEEGVAQGFDRRYKCRVRKPWYTVPHVYWPEAFLTSMSGERPSIVVNDANVLASNSLHILRSVDGNCDARAIALGWLSSITALSIEIEGHALGGGMLKLEPTEAERVIVPNLHGSYTNREFRNVDGWLRRGDFERAAAFVDARVGEVTGISARSIRRMKESAAQLRNRRVKRRK